jgi:hypothetical protein
MILPLSIPMSRDVITASPLSAPAERAQLVARARAEAAAVLRAQISLLPSRASPSVRVDALASCAALLSPASFGDVVLERSIAGVCGYPPCGAALPARRLIPSLRESLDRARAGAPEQPPVDEVGRFCSRWCWKGAIFFSAQLDDARGRGGAERKVSVVPAIDTAKQVAAAVAMLPQETASAKEEARENSQERDGGGRAVRAAGGEADVAEAIARLTARAHTALNSLRATVAGDAQAAAIADAIIVKERGAGAAGQTITSTAQERGAAAAVAQTNGTAERAPPVCAAAVSAGCGDDTDSDDGYDDGVKRAVALDSAALRRAAAEVHRAAVTDEDIFDPKVRHRARLQPACPRSVQKPPAFPRMMDYGRLRQDFSRDSDDDDTEANELAAALSKSSFMSDVVAMQVEPAPPPPLTQTRK